MKKTSLLLLALVALAGTGTTRLAATEKAAPVWPTPTARTLRLFEIAVHRYVPSTNGTILEKRYMLDARGGLTPVEVVTVPAGVTIPEDAFDRVLIPSASWTAYQRLGPTAFANFELTTEIPYLIADRQQQFEVRAVADPKLDVGNVVNLSTRSRLVAGEKMIAGFVITGESKRVLIRAVGPTLGNYGVASPMADTFLAIFKGVNFIHFNDNWNEASNAGEISTVSAQVGAFPLPAGSRDSALLVELQPGAYTVQVESETAAGGNVLVEVYTVP